MCHWQEGYGKPIHDYFIWFAWNHLNPTMSWFIKWRIVVPHLCTSENHSNCPRFLTGLQHSHTRIKIMACTSEWSNKRLKAKALMEDLLESASQYSSRWKLQIFEHCLVACANHKRELLQHLPQNFQEISFVSWSAHEIGAYGKSANEIGAYSKQ